MSSTQQLLLGEGAGGGPANYIEDVFSTYLYEGNDTSQTITNNIDLSTKGGLVWIKSRSGTYSTGYHVLNDTVRGAQKALFTNTTGAQNTGSQNLTAFTSTGFSVGNSTDVNGGTTNMVSWTFREQPKFFDVVTYTGNGSTQNIAHNLGSVPGMMVVKKTSNTGNWPTWHRSLEFGKILNLNLTTDGTSGPFPTYFGNNTTAVDPTSTQFTVGSNTNVNDSGATYVAYLFAHDAGGFGLTGSDNVISCGGYTGNNTSQSITLGYEPQWILAKPSSAEGDWFLFDNMRGIATGGSEKTLKANDSAAESNAVNALSLNATGFDLPSASFNNSGVTYIYIAIRRGPMKVPTSGTSVYNGVNDNSGLINVGFVPDLALVNTKAQWDRNPAYARLYGAFALRTNDTSAEESATVYWDAKTGYFEQSNTGGTPMSWFFGRAPGYFDVVCYSGTGTVNSKNHNLGVVPELIIVKKRSAGGLGRPWYTYVAPLGVNAQLLLNTNEAVVPESFMDGVAPTSSVFTLYSGVQVNGSGDTYVAYLFATCPGVSKVGSYTGTGTTLQINCGFTSGARFVMIKRTSSTGDWYVWDSTRGIIAGNDPYLLMNSVAAEVTGTDYVDTYSAGFEISSTAPAAINGSGGTFIFLAIA